MDKRQGQQPMQQFRVVNTQNRLFEGGRFRGKIPLDYVSKKRYTMEVMGDGDGLEEDPVYHSWLE